MIEWERIHTNVCTSHACDSEEELSELIRSARNVPKPDVLQNEDVYISDDNIEDFNLVYSTGDPEKPDDPHEYTAITGSIIENDRFHLHSIVQRDHIGQIIPAHQRMVADASEIDVGYIMVSYDVDIALDTLLDNLEFMDVKSDGPQMDAINFVEGDLDITIANHPVETLVTILEKEIDPIEPATLGARIDTTVAKAEEKLGEITS
ncbi:MAG: hypothetical protein ACOCYZ_02155 [Halococcoides sp.]